MLDLQWKLPPFGPANFCANPAVIHVGDLIQVYNCFTCDAILETICMPLLPLPITATLLPLKSIDSS